MSSRAIEQIAVGSTVALITALINQLLAGRVSYWWILGFLGSAFFYTVYQTYGRFPFTKLRVTNIDDGKGLLFRSDTMEGRHVGSAWQFRASIRDWAVFGPYLREPLRKGRYTATFKIKIDDVTGENRPVIDLDVASRCKDRGDKRLSVRCLTLLDFKKADEYQGFALDFEIYVDERDLEFRVFSLGSGHVITLDFVRLSKRLF